MLQDREWVRRSFMLPSNYAEVVDVRRDLYRNAANKFTDTTLGGNFAINPPPQYSSWTDPVVTSGYSASTGMGRYYSEAIDDHTFNITMGFGVAAFNSLTTFFSSYYNPDASALARTGRGKGFFYVLGRAAGFVVTVPFIPVILMGKAMRFALDRPSSKYYYLKPTMHNYWSAVTQMVNMLLVNMKMVPMVMPPSKESNPEYGEFASEFNPDYDQEDIQAYHRLLPDVWSEDGGIDIYKVVTRSQRLAQRQGDNYRAALEKEQNNTIAGVGQTLRDLMKDKAGSEYSSEFGGQVSFRNYMDAWEQSTAAGYGEGGADGLREEDATSWRGEDSGFFEFLEASLREGTRFVTFRVNNGGDSVEESVSNSTKESELASTINGMSSSMRDKRFSFAGGNLTDNFVGNTIEKFAGSVADLASGAAASVGLSGLMQLGGSAFADIPEMWDDSEFTFPTYSYTMELRSPYGNKLSRFQNLYVPLCMILAAALPLSTGKASYTSPFLVELFSRGRGQVRLGIIDSLTITRGVGNLAWTSEGEPLGIDVSFTVKDLSSIMHMPLRAETLLSGGVFSGFLDDDTAFTDYMATLGSLTLADQYYRLKKLKLRMARRLRGSMSFWSTARLASWSYETPPGQLMSAFMRYAPLGDYNKGEVPIVNPGQ